MDDVANDLVRIIPQIGWIVFAGIALVLFRSTIRTELLPRLSSFNFMGAQASFVEKSLDDAIEIAEKTTGNPIAIPDQERRLAVNQAMEHSDAFRARRVLWVDDNPSNNRNERRMFRLLGTSFQNVVTTADALAALGLDDFDCVISDMARAAEDGPSELAGTLMLTKFRREKIDVPVVFYIGDQPDPPAVEGALGITHRPDKLLLLVLDAFMRGP